MAEGKPNLDHLPLAEWLQIDWRAEAVKKFPHALPGEWGPDRYRTRINWEAKVLRASSQRTRYEDAKLRQEDFNWRLDLAKDYGWTVCELDKEGSPKECRVIPSAAARYMLSTTTHPWHSVKVDDKDYTLPILFWSSDPFVMEGKPDD